MITKLTRTKVNILFNEQAQDGNDWNVKRVR